MNPTHLYEALSPIFVVSLLLGTSPLYSQQNNGKHYLRTSNVLKLITVLYVFIYSSSVIYGISNMNVKSSIGYLKNAMSTIGLLLDSVGQILLVYTIYLFTFIIPKNVKNVIDKMAIIDSVLHELGHKNNYSKTFWQQIIMLFAGISSILFAIATQYYSLSTQSMFQLSETMWFIYYFPIIIIYVMECQFSFVVFLIYQRFQIINEILNQMSTNASNKAKNSKITAITDVQPVNSKESQTPTVLRKIEILMQIHDSLVDAANELNTNYSFQILMCLTVLFIKTVFAVFFSYFELFTLGKTFVSLNWFIWVAIDWCEILLITVSCHWASGQAQQTGVEVHKLLMNSQDNIIRDKLIVFSQQIFHRQVDFTACGLFTIDAELLFTILGSSSTYLIIMLQFQEGNEANCIIANATVH